MCVGVFVLLSLFAFARSVGHKIDRLLDPNLGSLSSSSTLSSTLCLHFWVNNCPRFVSSLASLLWTPLSLSPSPSISFPGVCNEFEWEFDINMSITNNNHMSLACSLGSVTHCPHLTCLNDLTSTRYTNTMHVYINICIYISGIYTRTYLSIYICTLFICMSNGSASEYIYIHKDTLDMHIHIIHISV